MNLGLFNVLRKQRRVSHCFIRPLRAQKTIRVHQGCKEFRILQERGCDGKRGKKEGGKGERNEIR